MSLVSGLLPLEKEGATIDEIYIFQLNFDIQKSWSCLSIMDDDSPGPPVPNIGANRGSDKKDLQNEIMLDVLRRKKCE